MAETFELDLDFFFFKCSLLIKYGILSQQICPEMMSSEIKLTLNYI